MSMGYIRKTYGVPAKCGMRVVYTDTNGERKPGVITAARGCYLSIRLDGQKHSLPYHPTYNIDYEAADLGARGGSDGN